MNIGIDLRPLQTGHKYRGIGEVTKQVTNRILSLAQKQEGVKFIFYEYDDDDPKELLTLPKGIEYAVIKQGLMPENNKNRTMSDKIRDVFNALYGNPVKGSNESDVFLQFDYAFGVPRDSKTLLIKHDLIPLVFWDQFFESAWVPFKNYAARTTIRTLFTNYKYNHVLRRSLHRAKKIATVSDSTKRDIIRFFHVNPKKIITTHLGVSLEAVKTDAKKASTTMPTKPYLLFVGAGDARRRIDDLVAAYNNLKAEGRNIQLVLAGENFQSPDSIPNKLTRQAVKESSYRGDILTVGYVDDFVKQELFRKAIAFVYPTQYEGFGIPILEAMLLECPAISYYNSSIPEVGGNHVYYARNWADIKRQAEYILSLPEKENDLRKKKAKTHAEQFTWEKTAGVIYRELVDSTRART